MPSLNKSWTSFWLDSYVGWFLKCLTLHTNYSCKMYRTLVNAFVRNKGTTQRRWYTEKKLYGELNWTFSFAQSKANPFAVTFSSRKDILLLNKVICTHPRIPFNTEFIFKFWNNLLRKMVWNEDFSLTILNNVRCNVVN